MKLRLRSIESKETLRVEVPNSCTLPELKQIVCQRLPSSPAPASVRLSLNQKDELQSVDGGSLLSLGIASGDLIFFSLGQPATGTDSISRNAVLPVEPTPKSESQHFECSTSLSVPNSLPEGSNFDSTVSDSGNGKTLESGAEESLADVKVEDECDEIRGNSAGLSADLVGKSFSVPCFLRKVFTEELDDDTGRNHKLIMIAIHAVMLEAGFLSFDKNANEVFSGFRVRSGWPSSLYGLSLCYTLPGCFSADSANATKSVVVKFQSLRNFITMYGTLGSGSGKGGTHRVQLNEDQLIPFLNVVWANCGDAEVVSETGQAVTSPEKEVFKFWRIVKDNLALPLLIDLCAEAGLELPPCFTRLPTDLKLKILESLPGGDLARVSCVCLDLRYLASSEDLWKLKFSEEFGHGSKEPYGSWKKAFVTHWTRRNNMKLAREVQSPTYPPGPYWPLQRRRQPNPLMVPRVPRIIGGDYDIFPPPFGDDMHRRLPHSANRSMRRFSPSCNLGIRGGRFI